MHHMNLCELKWLTPSFWLVLWRSMSPLLTWRRRQYLRPTSCCPSWPIRHFDMRESNHWFSAYCSASWTTEALWGFGYNVAYWLTSILHSSVSVFTLTHTLTHTIQGKLLVVRLPRETTERQTYSTRGVGLVSTICFPLISTAPLDWTCR